MAPLVHRVFSNEVYEAILYRFQVKVEELYAIYGYTDYFVAEVRRLADYDGDVPGLKEWTTNYLREKREAKERQEREVRLAYASKVSMVYPSQESIGLLEKIYELLKDIASRMSRFLPSSSPKKPKTFRMLLQGENKDDVLKRLHACIDGKSGKDVARVLRKAKELKMISDFPNEKQFCSEFKLLGTWRNLYGYFYPKKDDDISSVVI